MMILFLVLIGLAVYYMVSERNKSEQKSSGRNDAIDVLKLRYANGEIDQETYQKTLKILEDK